VVLTPVRRGGPAVQRHLFTGGFSGEPLDSGSVVRDLSDRYTHVSECEVNGRDAAMPPLLPAIQPTSGDAMTNVPLGYCDAIEERR
jgi:hypothetical protein